MATLNPGDEVIIPAPYWVSYPDMVLLAGGEPVAVPTTMSPGFKMTPEALERAITPRPNGYLINSPSNPTGAAYTRAELKELTDVLVTHPHVWVMTDDMYEHLVYDDFEFFTPAQLEPQLYERTLTVNGMSKAYCMTGWRIGYAGGAAAADPGNGDDPVAVDLQSHSGVAMGFGRGARRAAGFHRQAQQDFQGTARSVRLDAQSGEWNSLPEAGRGFLCLSVLRGHHRQDRAERQVLVTDEDFVSELLDAEGVAVVQGTPFGVGPAFRISYATKTEDLEEACGRIQRFCGNLR